MAKVGTDRSRIRRKFSGSDQKGPDPTGSGSATLGEMNT